MPKITEIDIVYASAIMDGEGCIRIAKVDALKINRPNNRYTLSIQVQMVDKKVIKWLHQKFGGYFYFQKMNIKDHPNWSDRYRWQLQNQNCEKFLHYIILYLKLKTPQAKLALKFLELERGDIKNKHKYYLKMTKLNQVGRKKESK